jgi:ClpP class serine protease
MHSAFAFAAKVPWAIEPEWLSMVFAIANRENDPLEAVEKKLGRKLENTRTVGMHDGVAVIPVSGPIFRHSDMLSAISGATNVATLARDLQTALEDPSVQAILFNFDSPGGEVNGIHEFAEQIAEAGRSKPVGAYVGGSAASAAYWLAVATGDITVDATARVGSIGVISGYPKPDDKAGTVEIVSSQSPRKRPDITTKEGRSVVQETVDAIADVFVADVARFRSVDPKVVEKDFGRGGVLVGETAVRAGMAERVGSLESAMVALRAKAERSHEEQNMKRVNRALGLAEDATEETAIAAIDKQKAELEKMTSAHKIASEQLEAQKVTIEGLQGKVQRGELEAYLDGDDMRARVTPALREQLLALGMKPGGAEEMKKLAAALPKVPGAPSGGPKANLKLVEGEDPVLAILTDGDRTYCEANDVDPVEFAKFKAAREKEHAREKKKGAR